MEYIKDHKPDAPIIHKFLVSVLTTKVAENFPLETADFITFTEEILTGKLHYLCSVVNQHLVILQF